MSQVDTALCMETKHFPWSFCIILDDCPFTQTNTSPTSIFDANTNFPCNLARHIFEHPSSQSFLQKNSHHGEENRNESGSCMKPGTGITAQAKVLTLKTHSPIDLREQLQLSLLC